ncbi:predicted protein [Sclerotinia sclerotiorum 1980 UF-70]|uniref:Uncharacterized protein n=1 Tax=Sclerotinia sclerotiorum (strain ATCC 18683 / 1980 / Ss-1) TaxID=665079 RepID=A7E8E2_SCLS1|nr:predicted protein [Sclerotinia sclerotiorum 1980 UF-70]EDN96644.1 predicted protein [Sclerotinia sclerotiorum 1980 UF-70]
MSEGCFALLEVMVYPIPNRPIQSYNCRYCSSKMLGQEELEAPITEKTSYKVKAKKVYYIPTLRS